MSTSEAAALLAAVRAAPDDDAPRLVYADWLDEHGQPDRAAFIRLQVERARLPRFDPRRVVLQCLADRLFDRHGADWRAELPQLDGIVWGAFDRGFPHAVLARTLPFFEQAADRLAAFAPIDTLTLSGPDAPTRLRAVRAYPWLRTLRIRHLGLIGRPADEFFDSPLLSTVRTLDLTGLGLENGGVAALARAGPLEVLRELILDRNAIGSGGLETLARARGLRGLTRLRVRGDGEDALGDDPIVRADGVEALAGSHVFADLEALDLAGNQVGDEAVAYIVQSPHLVNLRELNLAANDLTADGLEILDEAGWEVRFESLDLSRNPIGDEGAERLAESEVGNELVRLVLDGCGIGPDGAAALARADWFPALQTLSLNDNEIGSAVRSLATAGAGLGDLRLRNTELEAAEVRAVARSASLAGLLTLDLSENYLGAAGVEAVGASPHLRRLALLDLSAGGLSEEVDSTGPALAAVARLGGSLVSLRLADNLFGEQGVHGLATDVAWPRLGELDLQGCGVNAPALTYLADGNFPALARLRLGSNLVDPAGLKALLTADWVGGLSHLDLSHNRVRTEGARLLAAADLPYLGWLSLEDNAVHEAGFVALSRSRALPRLTTLRYGNNPAGDWWRRLPDHFPGGAVWPDELPAADGA